MGGLRERWRVDPWITLALLLFCWALARADESPSALFDRANKLYEQGKYTEALAAYQQLAEEGQVSPAVYFNMGNAWMKSGKVGRAIVCYRLAQRMAPRDADIRANLFFARQSVPGTGARIQRWQRWINVLTLNELAIVAMTAFWICFLLLALGQLRRDWARGLRPYVIATAATAAGFALWLGAASYGRLLTSSAVVVQREAGVRYGPFEEAQRFYTLRDGAEVTVLNRKDTWLQVRDGSKRTGWLQDKDVVVLPRG